MWCRQCQQDVPAVARTSQGPLLCPRCSRELQHGTLAEVADAGIALDSYGSAPAKNEALTKPIPGVQQEASREKLKRIGRQLRSPYQEEIKLGSLPTSNSLWHALPIANEPIASPQLRQVAKQAHRESATSTSQTSWVLSSVLTLGALGFSIGIAILAWSASFDLQELWHWGMTTTIAAEGLLIVGLTWMATRLWHNSRRINHELRGVDQQLVDIHKMAGSLSAGQLSASQNYYHHFSQVANPHMLVANLRGQIDQLAERIGG